MNDDSCNININQNSVSALTKNNHIDNLSDNLTEISNNTDQDSLAVVDELFDRFDKKDASLNHNITNDDILVNVNTKNDKEEHITQLESSQTFEIHEDNKTRNKTIGHTDTHYDELSYTFSNLVKQVKPATNLFMNITFGIYGKTKLGEHKIKLLIAQNNGNYSYHNFNICNYIITDVVQMIDNEVKKNLLELSKISTLVNSDFLIDCIECNKIVDHENYAIKLANLPTKGIFQIDSNFFNSKANTEKNIYNINSTDEYDVTPSVISPEVNAYKNNNKNAYEYHHQKFDPLMKISKKRHLQYLFDSEHGTHDAIDTKSLCNVNKMPRINTHEAWSYNLSDDNNDTPVINNNIVDKSINKTIPTLPIAYYPTDETINEYNNSKLNEKVQNNHIVDIQFNNTTSNIAQQSDKYTGNNILYCESSTKIFTPKHNNNSNDKNCTHALLIENNDAKFNPDNQKNILTAQTIKHNNNNINNSHGSSSSKVSNNTSSYRASKSNTTRQTSNNYTVPYTFNNPNFIKDYFQNSRLHFLGTWNKNFAYKHIIKPFRPLLYYEIESINHNAKWDRTRILHIDFDNFFTSVSISMHKNKDILKEMPVIVSHGSAASSTSEIASCNNVAKAAGIKKGMYVKHAYAICSNIQVLPYNLQLVYQIADELIGIALQITSRIIPQSCDEIYIQLTGEQAYYAVYVAYWIRKLIYIRTNCMVSIGIGDNLYTAKMATNLCKLESTIGIECIPGHEKLFNYILTVEKRIDNNGEIPKFDEIENLSERLLITKLWMQKFELSSLHGIGSARIVALNNYGIKTIVDMQNADINLLTRLLGPTNGNLYKRLACGLNHRIPKIPVLDESNTDVTVNITWGIRLRNTNEVKWLIEGVVDEIVERFDCNHYTPRIITLKFYIRSPDADIVPAKYGGSGPTYEISSRLLLYNKLFNKTNTMERLYELWVEQLQFKCKVDDIRGIYIGFERLEKIADKEKKSILDMLKKSFNNTTKKNIDEISKYEQKNEYDSIHAEKTRSNEQEHNNDKDVHNTYNHYYAPNIIHYDLSNSKNETKKIDHNSVCNNDEEKKKVQNVNNKKLNISGKKSNKPIQRNTINNYLGIRLSNATITDTEINNVKKNKDVKKNSTKNNYTIKNWLAKNRQSCAIEISDKEE